MAITWGSSITLGCIMRDSKETQQPSKIIGNLRVLHQTPTFRNCNIYTKNMVSEIILNRDPKKLKLYHHSHCFNGHKIGEKTPFSENTMSWCFRLRPGTDVGTLLHRSTGIGIWWKRELQQKSLRKKSRISPEIRCKHTELSHKMANLRYPATKWCV